MTEGEGSGRVTGHYRFEDKLLPKSPIADDTLANPQNPHGWALQRVDA